MSYIKKKTVNFVLLTWYSDICPMSAFDIVTQCMYIGSGFRTTC